MHGTLLSPHERKALAINGVTAARQSRTDFAPVVRLWFPTSPLSWLLTHTRIEDDDLAYGLAIQNGHSPVYEFGHWSIAAFEGFAVGSPATCLKSSSVFRVNAPLSSYVRALVRRRIWGV